MRDRLVALYKSGLSALKAAIVVGCGRSSCYNALKEAGVASRSFSVSKRKYAINEDYFAAIDTDEKAYWLGFITADGCVMRGKTLSIILARKDRGHLESLAKHLESTHPISDYAAKAAGKMHEMSSVRFHSQKLVAQLLQLGIEPRKTFTVEPWHGPVSLMPAYWRGVVDGDGSVMKSKPSSTGRCHWRIGMVGNRAMMDGFADFVAGITGKRREPRPKNKIFSLFFGGVALPQKIAAILYGNASISLLRKKLAADELLAAPINHRNTDGWTADLLVRLRGDHGSWDAVCRFLRIDNATLNRIRKRRGIL